MSNSFTVYPKKLSKNASSYDKLCSEMTKQNQRMQDIQAEIRNNRLYSSIARNLAKAISESEGQIRSARNLQKALQDAVALYEKTENRIVSGAEVSGKDTDKGSGNSRTREEEDFIDYLLEAFWQAIAGDFTDDGNGLGILLSVIVGFIPYVGQAADIRDLIANIYNLFDDGPETKEWVDLGFTLLGIIPGIGDLVKHADNLAPVLKNLDDIVDGLGEATQGVIKHADEMFSAVDDMVKQFNDILDKKVISKLTDEIDEMLDGVMDFKKAVDKVQDVLAKEINKKADTIGDFVEELAKEYTGIEDGIKDFISDGIDFIFGNEEEVGDAVMCSNDFSCMAVA